jgi:hypothetical protein
MADAFLDAWVFPHDFALRSITEIAMGKLTPPDLRVLLISSRADVLAVQVAQGETPPHPNMRLYVGGRGAFEILRREPWPEGRELLTLSAWPSRER